MLAIQKSINGCNSPQQQRWAKADITANRDWSSSECFLEICVEWVTVDLEAGSPS